MDRVKAVIISLVLAVTPLSAFAAAGCCSSHGGVTGCNEQGQQVCKDGTASASCPCPATGSNSQQGCCSNHGGVVGCDGKHSVCKDQSVSKTCKCHTHS